VSIKVLCQFIFVGVYKGASLTLKLVGLVQQTVQIVDSYASLESQSNLIRYNDLAPQQ
jgi:hypothetical protein